MIINYLQDVEPTRQHHLWYNSDVVSIDCSEGIKFIISADGIISGTVTNDLKYKNIINGQYKNIMRNTLLCSKYDDDIKILEELKRPNSDIWLYNSNYWTMYCICNNKEIDLQCTFKESLLYNVINSAINKIPEYIKWIYQVADIFNTKQSIY